MSLRDKLKPAQGAAPISTGPGCSMGRVTETALIPAEPVKGGAPSWMNDLTGLVNNVKETVNGISEMAKALKTQAPAGSPAGTVAPAPGAAQFMAFLEASGLSDVPLGKIITTLAPYSINDIKKNALTLLGKIKE